MSWWRWRWLLLTAAAGLAQLAMCNSELNSRLRAATTFLERQQRLLAEVDRHVASVVGLQQQLDAAALSSKKQIAQQLHWRQGVDGKLALLSPTAAAAALQSRGSSSSSSDLSSGSASVQRRGLANHLCSEPPDAQQQLKVHGVCSCTRGLLVDGRNVTEELDALHKASASATTTTTTTTTTTSTASPYTLASQTSDSCSSLGLTILTKTECFAAAASLNLVLAGQVTLTNSEKGCYYAIAGYLGHTEAKVFYNGQGDSSSASTRVICK
eukprot:INCI9697.1.p1 GENE.INCI9697.1~~INCI9697.1.p1  ORF type:complete len:269 (-),score=51.58 INCI9697.1:334-1140(-)